ncbi:MAG TPA: carboxylating nicotinate-nucleotide diphosphorylase [Candidatus Krumholzibacteria bacterium]|nr:carboxylating nicotinate-nucleotide diphosphorylase [Candidatus Krumholzibacteria bacterium]
MTRLDPPDMERMVAMVQAAITEDGARNDATVAFLDLGEREAEATIDVSAMTTLSGIDMAREVFRQIDPACAFDALHRDGDRLAEGKTICRIHGRAASIVAAERTALNFLQHMSGVATLASRFVNAVAGTGVVILDTRKTIPLWRELDKYAVRCGGAQNHRRSLDAMVLVKDNHVRVLGGPQALIDIIAARGHDGGFVEVEVDSMQFLAQLLTVHVDRILLDNFTPGQVGDALELVRAQQAARAAARIEIEVSGGITLDTVRDYALPGVDYISVGALTHSAPAAHMSLSVR